MKKLTIIPIPLSRDIMAGDIYQDDINGKYSIADTKYLIDVSNNKGRKPIQIILASEDEIKDPCYYVILDSKTVWHTNGISHVKSDNEKKIIALYPSIEGVYGMLPEQHPLLDEMLNRKQTECEIEMDIDCDKHGYNVADESCTCHIEIPKLKDNCVIIKQPVEKVEEKKIQTLSGLLNDSEIDCKKCNKYEGADFHNPDGIGRHISNIRCPKCINGKLFLKFTERSTVSGEVGKTFTLNEIEYRKFIESKSKSIRFDIGGGIGIKVICLNDAGKWIDITDYNNW
ncbi:MAG: hypothetical protein WC254_07370 [Candidatus Woesearchaeota archaeon]|jgi:hypothetical protein